MPLDLQFKEPPPLPPALTIPKRLPWYRYGYFLESPFLGLHHTVKITTNKTYEVQLITLEHHQSQVYLVIVPHIDSQKLLHKKSRLA